MSDCPDFGTCDEFCNPYRARPHSDACHRRWWAWFKAWLCQIGRDA